MPDAINEQPEVDRMPKHVRRCRALRGRALGGWFGLTVVGINVRRLMQHLLQRERQRRVADGKLLRQLLRLLMQLLELLLMGRLTKRMI